MIAGDDEKAAGVEGKFAAKGGEEGSGFIELIGLAGFGRRRR